MMKFLHRIFLIQLFLIAILNSNYAQLSGTFSIGSGKDFNTIQDAVDSIILVGISGATTFEIDSGTYNEQISLFNINGASFSNQIIFRAKNDSVNDVIITSTAPATVSLNGAKHIVFNYLTLTNTANNVVKLTNHADSVTINNCIVNGPNVNANDRSKDAILCDNNSSSDYFSLLNSEVYHGSCGVYLVGINGDYEQGHRIENNIIKDSYVHDLGIVRANNVIVKNNVISCNKSQINTNGCAIIIHTTSNSIIENNTVFGNKHGLRIHNNSINDSILVINNMVSSNYSVYSHYPLYLSNGNKNLKIYNNSFYQGYNNPNGAIMALANGADKNISIYNNIFYSVSQFSGSFASSPEVYDINYNNFYDQSEKGLILFNSNTISVAENASDLPGGNNVSINPLFESFSNLHVTNSALGNIGLPLTEVAFDFDGETRDANQPDIGADEFSPFDSLDVAIISNTLIRDAACNGPNAIELSLKNIGSKTLNSFKIERTINGTIIDTSEINEVLNSYESSNITINYPEYNDGDTLSLNVISIDNAADPRPENSSLTKKGIWKSMYGVISVQNSSEFDSVFTELAKRGICGNVSIELSPGKYQNRLRIYEIEGTNENAQIIIESSTGVKEDVIIAPDNASNFVFDIIGTDYLTLQNLTVKADSINAYAISIDSRSEHCTFNNLHLLGDADRSMDVFRSSSHADNYLTIRNCIIENGDYGIYMDGNDTEDGIRIENNTILNSYNGMYCGNIKNLVITDNYIQLDSSYNADGIEIEYIYGNLTLTNNQLIIDSTTGAGALIEYFYGTGAISSYIAGNSFDIGGSAWAGIYFYEIPNGKFYNNTIRMSSNNTNDYALYLDYFSSLDIRNNNIVAENKATAVYYDSYITGVRYMDYNNIYSDAYLVRFGNEIITDFAVWQEKGWDKMSISTDPGFFNGTTPCNTALNAAGTIADGIPAKDVLGKYRDLNNPDIGAIEIGQNTGVYLGEDITLCNASYTLNAGENGTSYLWSTGATTPNILVTQSGTYTVEVEGICNITSYDTIEVFDSYLKADFEVVSFKNQAALLNKSQGKALHYSWNYGLGVSNEENILVDFKNEGSYNIVFTVTNECQSSVLDTTIDIYTLDIENISMKSSLQVYPNPVVNELNIELYSNNNSNQEVRIYNLQGRLIDVQEVRFNNGLGIINLSPLDAGIYILKTEDNSARIIKQ